MCRWQRMGVVISVLWLIGLPIYLLVDANRQASKALALCLSVARTDPEMHWCQADVRFVTPSEMAHAFVAGNNDAIALWALMLGPIIICWIMGSIAVATARWGSSPAYSKVRLRS
jgi:hypothetical protein